jgi:aminopeptidase-like protein
MDTKLGEEMHGWARDLFPICRSITGQGVRDTLLYLKNIIPDLEIVKVPSGTKAFDWTVPEEWNIQEGWIKDENGDKIIDFLNNNLHVVGYSDPINYSLSLNDLQKHLHSLPENPEAIPYVTSYYKSTWGFCLSDSQRIRLKDGIYEVKINSKKHSGELNYGEVVINGSSKEEIFISTYICHPSMANNELSGPVVSTALVRHILKKKNRRYTYRIVFIPETIGSIVYLSKKIKHLQENVIAGFNVTCIGDDRCYSYLPSRDGNTLADRISKHVLKNLDGDFKSYKWIDRGSDERQYCAPGVDLPIASVMRSKYGEYPEYHTSLDDLNFVTPSGLKKGFDALRLCIEGLEINHFPIVNVLCEPHLTKYNLYPTTSNNSNLESVRILTNFVSYCDGSNDVIDIANKIGVPIWKLSQIIKTLLSNKLIRMR